MATVATFGAGCGSGKVCANEPQTLAQGKAIPAQSGHGMGCQVHDVRSAPVLSEAPEHNHAQWQDVCAMVSERNESGACFAHAGVGAMTKSRIKKSRKRAMLRGKRKRLAMLAKKYA